MDELTFRLYINPGHASCKEIISLFEALSDLNKYLGGQGLSFRVIPQSEYAAQDRKAMNAGCIPVDVSPWTLGDTIEQEFKEYLKHPEKFL